MKRLTFVFGKGGVGKTTISLALALKAAQQGNRVLLAEINSEAKASTGVRETPSAPSLHRLNITPKKSFEEYVLTQLHSRILYRAVFENRFVRNFIEATPGLADLMCIGKVYSLRDHYDHLVVDAPATGHGLALLQIAGIVSGAVRVGPLRTHAEAIDALLHDPRQTEIILVSLPEEMPVVETLEMKEKLQEDLKLPVGGVVLNQVHASPLTAKERSELQRLHPGESLPLQAMRIQLAKVDRSLSYRKKLEEELGELPLYEVPFIYSSSLGLEEVQKIADGISL